MLDYKQLFGFASILFGIGFILQSIIPAQANPSGPSISFGSNPYRSEYRTGNGTLLTTSANETFIVTSIHRTYTGCILSINGTNTFTTSGNNNISNLHLVVPPNSIISTTGSNCNGGLYIDGYYIH